MGKRPDANAIHKKHGREGLRRAIDESEVVTPMSEPEPETKANGAANAKAKKAKKAKPNGKPASPSMNAKEIENEIIRLAGLSDFQYQRERINAAKALDVPVRFLDGKVKAEQEGLGRTQLRELEPWPDEVDGERLLDEIARTIRRHVSLPKHADAALALWLLSAHSFDAADISPRVAITSAAPECGKTTCMELIEALSPRPLLASNATAAAVFRAIDAWRPTLLIDEADTFLPNNEELRGVLNSGHKKQGAYVLRTVGDNHIPQRFTTWCPMAVALIGKLPPTLDSRSIHIPLKRMSRGEGKGIEPFDAGAEPYLHLARQAARWAADHVADLRGKRPVPPEGFRNRAADNWRPLLAIADLVGEAWAEYARTAAVALTPTDAGQTRLELLLADIHDILGAAESIFSAELAAKLGEREDRPWSDYRAGKPITTNGLARLLKPLGIAPRNVRVGNDQAKGYEAADFADAFERYLAPDPPFTTVQPSQSP